MRSTTASVSVTLSAYGGAPLEDQVRAPRAGEQEAGLRPAAGAWGMAGQA